MTENDQKTAGGLIGRLAGKTKETAGSLTGDDDHAREGRLQQEAVSAKDEAQERAAKARQAEQQAELAEDRARNEQRRKELENELTAEQREEQAARDRASAEADAVAEERQRERQAETERELQENAASATETRAAVDEVHDLQDAASLEAEARRAEARAEAIEDEER